MEKQRLLNSFQGKAILGRTTLKALTDAALKEEETAKLRKTSAPEQPTKNEPKAKRIGDLTVGDLQGLAARRIMLGLLVTFLAYLFLSLVNPGY